MKNDYLADLDSMTCPKIQKSSQYDAIMENLYEGLSFYGEAAKAEIRNLH